MEKIGIDELRRISEGKGSKFFAPSNTRFFRSRYPAMGYKLGQSVYFVTSEQFDYRSPRLYTIRAMDLATGEMSEVGGFQQFSTRARALGALARVLGEKEEARV